MGPGAPTRSYGFVRYVPEKGITIIDPACLCNYQWLSRVAVPRMVVEAIDLWKVTEQSGLTTSSQISHAEMTAIGRILPSLDPVPRAGLVLAVLARRARKTVPDNPQCALNWVTFGTEAGQPRAGDVLCTLSGVGASVGLYIGEDDEAFHCLGVTKEDKMGVERVMKQHLYSVRRPLYEGAQCAPNGIRLNRDGTLLFQNG